MVLSNGERLLWIGWESADWFSLDPLLDAGKLPHLESLIDSGARGSLTCPLPFVRPMLWTTAGTGADSFDHRVASDFEPDGKGGYRPVGTHSRKHPAVWNRLSAAGKRCIVVGWPNTDHEDAVNGIFVPEPWSLAPLGSKHSSICPENRQATIDEMLVQPQELGSEFVDAITAGVADLDLVDNQVRGHVAKAVAATSSIHNVVTLLATESDWDLLTAVYPLVGGSVRRVLGRFTEDSDSLTNSQQQAVSTIEENCWQLLDQMLGRLLNLIPQDTTVLLFSTGGLYTGSLPPIQPMAREKASKQQVYRWNTRRRNCERGIFVWSGSDCPRDELIDEVPLTNLARLVSEHFEIEPFDKNELKSACNDSQPPDTEAVWQRQRLLDDLQSLGFIEPLPQSFALEDLCRIRADNLVEAAMYSGRLAEASKMLHKIIMHNQRPECIALLAECQLGMKNFDDALVTINSLQQFKPSRTTMLSLNAKRSVMMGDSPSALNFLHEALKRDDRDRVALSMGNLAMAIQHPKLAVRFFEIATQRRPVDGRARLALGNALLAAGNPADAVEQHRMAIRLLPSLKTSHDALARSLMASGDQDGAANASAAASKFSDATSLTLRRQKSDGSASEDHE